MAWDAEADRACVVQAIRDICENICPWGCRPILRMLYEGVKETKWQVKVCFLPPPLALSLFCLPPSLLLSHTHSQSAVLSGETRISRMQCSCMACEAGAALGERHV